MTDTAPVAPAPAATPPAPPAASAPAAPAGGSEVTLYVTEPRVDRFVSGVEGWDVITRDGTSGPADKAHDVIEAGEAANVTIERR